MSKTSKQNRDTRIDFYLTFFQDKEGYEENEVNGFWLVKYWAGHCWSVALYSKDSFNKMKRAQQQFGERKQQMDFLKDM
jgi:hypothetical protein